MINLKSNIFELIRWTDNGSTIWLETSELRSTYEKPSLSRVKIVKCVASDFQHKCVYLTLYPLHRPLAAIIGDTLVKVHWHVCFIFVERRRPEGIRMTWSDIWSINLPWWERFFSSFSLVLILPCKSAAFLWDSQAHYHKKIILSWLEATAFTFAKQFYSSLPVKQPQVCCKCDKCLKMNEKNKLLWFLVVNWDNDIELFNQKRRQFTESETKRNIEGSRTWFCWSYSIEHS